MDGQQTSGDHPDYIDQRRLTLISRGRSHLAFGDGCVSHIDRVEVNPKASFVGQTIANQSPPLRRAPDSVIGFAGVGKWSGAGSNGRQVRGTIYLKVDPEEETLCMSPN
jgi:hypothetical protein